MWGQPPLRQAQGRLSAVHREECLSQVNEKGQHLAGLSDFIGKPISLQAEATGSPEAYDIVLM